MPVSCCIVGCTSRHTNGRGEASGYRFFRIPRVKRNQGQHTEEVTTRRRQAWVAAIRRPSITFDKSTEAMRVCSRHFHAGEPAYEMSETHPDWAPSLHLGHLEVKETSTSRHERLSKRRRTMQSMESEEMEAVLSDGAAADCDDSLLVEPELEPVHSVYTQTDTDITGGDIDGMQYELNRLLEENRDLKKKLKEKEITLEAFEEDDEKVKFYTGLPSFATLVVVLNHLAAFLPQGTRRLLSPFQMLMMTLMRLRLNLPVQHLAYMFEVHRTTISNAFIETVSVLYSRLSCFVYWPDRDSLKCSMPHQFVEAFGQNVAVIIDCFEIFIERPSNLKARAQTFSHYKHNNTIKYLIGITPQGVISFLSKGYGGRASDKFVTEDSGFLDKLVPGDKILADRGFDIQESVGFMCAEVFIPAFTRGKCQMQAKDVEATRKLAHLRIHVERVIGNVVGKYTLLTNTLPINLVLPCKDEELTFLDKLVHVCCALTNICPSVV